MLIYIPGEHTLQSETLIGGKAYNLDVLARNGFSVPPYFVITTEAFEAVLRLNGYSYNKISGIEKNKKWNTPDSLRTQLEAAFEKFKFQDCFLAIRSSVVGEDSPEHSFAGLFESFLYVRPQDVMDRIKKVWSSVFSDRVMAYVQKNNIDFKTLKMAVVIQQMIPAEVSGVAFGFDPISGSRDKVVISSVFGLGEGLVSGELDADVFTVKDGKIQKEIADKNEALWFNNILGTGTCKQDVAPELVSKQSLLNEQILDITRITQQLNRLYNKPQDVEWAIKESQLFILQTRPITTLSHVVDKSQFKQIWDNSNIIESYPGVTLPLTFSFIQNVYTEVYKQFCLILGVEDELISKNNHIFKMLGYFKGRVYYNLVNWYNVLSLLPGYEINAEFMEQMMGVREKFNEHLTTVPATGNKYLRLTNLCFLLIWNYLWLPVESRKYHRLIDETLNPLDNSKLNTFNLKELANCHYNLENTLIKKWQAPLVNDFFCMIFFGLVKKLIEKWDLDTHSTLQNDLMVGLEDIVSREPARLLANITKYIQNNNLQDIFSSNEPYEILQNIKKDKKLFSIINSYLSQYGDRCPEELKLETITYKHNPELLIDIIKTYLKHDTSSGSTKEQGLRKTAEKIIKEKLGTQIHKKILFLFILKNARARIRGRENLRFERTRVYSTVREIFLTIGSKLAYEGIIDNQRDVFYLTKEEIFSFIAGTSASTNLKAIINYRKFEFEEYNNISLPDRFETYGAPYFANKYDRHIKQEFQTSELSGIACSPGVIRAKVKLVRNPSEAEGLEGCIMAAKRTDPGWVPLFLIAKGIIVERGSLLSHSAIVAREMGIPAIVGVKGLFDNLREGQEIEMDGSTGIIKKIN